ncbi:MAG: glycine cleavage system protein T, partial [Actinobacteria bacterium]|nr:glycine cleavage system protein T [Actinomycetota bacterium]
GLWSAAAVWVKEGPGVGRAMAEWMVLGQPEIDLHASDIARFYPEQTTTKHIRDRASEGFNKTYGIVHPAEQWSSNRGVRKSPYYDREAELGAVFYETVLWERPFWYESNAGLVEKYGDAVMPRTAEWESRWWSPIINAEHLQMRETAGLVDLTAFALFDITGPGALATVQRVCMRQMDVAVGKVVYTPVLAPNGGFRSDLTVMRLGDDHFRVVTGGAHGMSDLKWFKDNAAEGATFTNLTDAISTIGLWGPNARAILSAVTDADVSHDAFGFGTCREITIAGKTVLASRISYVGDLGWELYVPMADGLAVWDAIWAAGQAHGLIPVGIGVYGTTGRLEKGYRAYGPELEGDFTVVEAGMAPKKIKDADFIGKEAHLRHREEAPAATMCLLTVDDHTSSTGEKRYMMGGEPILTKDGQAIVDAHGRRSYVTSAGSGPSVGKHILMTYLPPEYSAPGTHLVVEYLGEQYPVTVTGSGALFDPDNDRILS